MISPTHNQQHHQPHQYQQRQRKSVMEMSHSRPSRQHHRASLPMLHHQNLLHPNHPLHHSHHHHSHNHQSPNSQTRRQNTPPNRNETATTELYTKSKAFLQDTLANSNNNSSSMKQQSNHQTLERSSSASNKQHCHLFHAFSRCFRFCSKPKDYSDGSKSGGEMDEGCSFELSQPSEILCNNDVNQLGQRLPPIAVGNSWKLTFSTTTDGFCLKSLYRKMLMCPMDSPVLIIIQDTKNRVFGVLASNALKISDHFYGSSQSFLFRCNPNFQVYKWGGDNFYFIKGNPDSIIFGSGNGKYGIWLDGDLNKGRTQSCTTFGSPPLVPEEDFIIKTLECWTFEKSNRKVSGETFWNHLYPTEHSLIPGDLKDLDDERQRKISITSKAEQEIVNQYVIGLTDELRSAMHSQEAGEFRPELIIGTSSILDIEDVVNIGKNLSYQCTWYLTFSTLVNGRSLETLYNKASPLAGSALLVIKTEDKRVFGALMSDPPKMSNGYYGTGQSFLFTCRPTFQVYRWTGKDQLFALGAADNLTFGNGGDNGIGALRINSTLTEGQTAECSTYGNTPLVTEGTFKIKILECWHFGIANQ